MIRIDQIWLAVEPIDMRFSPDTAVVQVFGAAHPHTAYLFANKRGNRLATTPCSARVSLKPDTWHMHVAGCSICTNLPRAR